MNNRGFKIFLSVFLAVLLSIVVVGLFWLGTGRVAGVGLILSYLAGISMIFLPCTFPLVFVIVPLSMGYSPKKGLTMAGLFGLGLAITLSLYGVLLALFGQYVGLDKATRIMFIGAGIAAYLFGLGLLNLLKIKLPYASKILPRSLQKKSDYFRSFFLGLFLGNAGIGCPNPAFYVLLTYIATVGSLKTGWFLGLIHGIGRATPLILLSLLAILGVNSINWISRNKVKMDKITGWALVFMGIFLFTYGFWGMIWWENSIFHEGWNNFIRRIAPMLAETEGHEIKQGLIENLLNLTHSQVFKYGWSTLIGLLSISFLWIKFKRKPEAANSQNNAESNINSS